MQEQQTASLSGQESDVEKEIQPPSAPAMRIPENVVNDCDERTKRIVEAILFAAPRAMTVKQIKEVFPEAEQPENRIIQAAIDAITLDYAERPIGLAKLASGYRFQIVDGMAPWISRLFEEKPPRYSRAMLETLAIIAYRQPVTRGEIEDIRGVSVSSQIIRTLLDREWIRVIAHKEVPGRPALYGTTKQLLDYFNLASLDELPVLEDIKEMDFDTSVNIVNPTVNSEPEQTTVAPPIQPPATETSVEENDRPEQAEFSSPDSQTLH